MCLFNTEVQLKGKAKEAILHKVVASILCKATCLQNETACSNVFNIKVQLNELVLQIT